MPQPSKNKVVIYELPIEQFVFKQTVFDSWHAMYPYVLFKFMEQYKTDIKLNEFRPQNLRVYNDSSAELFTKFKASEIKLAVAPELWQHVDDYVDDDNDQ